MSIINNFPGDSKEYNVSDLGTSQTISVLDSVTSISKGSLVTVGVERVAATEQGSDDYYTYNKACKIDNTSFCIVHSRYTGVDSSAYYIIIDVWKYNPSEKTFTLTTSTTHLIPKSNYGYYTVFRSSASGKTIVAIMQAANTTANTTYTTYTVSNSSITKAYTGTFSGITIESFQYTDNLRTNYFISYIGSDHSFTGVRVFQCYSDNSLKLYTTWDLGDTFSKYYLYTAIATPRAVFIKTSTSGGSNSKTLTYTFRQVNDLTLSSSVFNYTISSSFDNYQTLPLTPIVDSPSYFLMVGLDWLSINQTAYKVSKSDLTYVTKVNNLLSTGFTFSVQNRHEMNFKLYADLLVFKGRYIDDDDHADNDSHGLGIYKFNSDLSSFHEISGLQSTQSDSVYPTNPNEGGMLLLNEKYLIQYGPGYPDDNLYLVAYNIGLQPYKDSGKAIYGIAQENASSGGTCKVLSLNI